LFAGIPPVVTRRTRAGGAFPSRSPLASHQHLARGQRPQSRAPVKRLCAWSAARSSCSFSCTCARGRGQAV